MAIYGARRHAPVRERIQAGEPDGSPGIPRGQSRRPLAGIPHPIHACGQPEIRNEIQRLDETVTIGTKPARTIEVHERMDGYALLWACAKAKPFIPATYHGRGQPISNHSMRDIMLPDPARFNSLRERIGYWQSVLALDEPEDQLTAAVHAALSVYRHLMDDNPLSGDRAGSPVSWPRPLPIGRWGRRKNPATRSDEGGSQTLQEGQTDTPPGTGRSTSMETCLLSCSTGRGRRRWRVG